MNRRSDLIARIDATERQLAFLREELEKEDKSRYYLEEKRDRFGGGLKAIVIRDRLASYSRSRTSRTVIHYPVAVLDRVGSMTEEALIEAANRLLAAYRGSEK